MLYRMTKDQIEGDLTQYFIFEEHMQKWRIYWWSDDGPLRVSITEFNTIEDAQEMAARLLVQKICSLFRIDDI
jgi:hypothetical protein